MSRQYQWWHNNSSTNYSSLATVPMILDITNISTHKVKFVVAGGPGSANTAGDDSDWYTGCQFIRWGPT